MKKVLLFVVGLAVLFTACSFEGKKDGDTSAKSSENIVGDCFPSSIDGHILEVYEDGAFMMEVEGMVFSDYKKGDKVVVKCDKVINYYTPIINIGKVEEIHESPVKGQYVSVQFWPENMHKENGSNVLYGKHMEACRCVARSLYAPDDNNDKKEIIEGRVIQVMPSEDFDKGTQVIKLRITKERGGYQKDDEVIVGFYRYVVAETNNNETVYVTESVRENDIVGLEFSEDNINENDRTQLNGLQWIMGYDE